MILSEMVTIILGYQESKFSCFKYYYRYVYVKHSYDAYFAYIMYVTGIQYLRHVRLYVALDIRFFVELLQKVEQAPVGFMA
ncbi:hypothetical protein MIDIC_20061 [Alphaproteobacteria bacterium]